jgi:hypothetical protein
MASWWARRFRTGRIGAAGARLAITLGLTVPLGCGSNGPGLERVPIGIWGGEHVTMDIARDGATLEFDCAHGRIEEGLVLDDGGRFRAAGWYVLEKGGPVVAGEEPVELPARYDGRLDGATLQLSVTLDADGRRIGPFVLLFGRPGRVLKCL